MTHNLAKSNHKKRHRSVNTPNHQNEKSEQVSEDQTKLNAEWSDEWRKFTLMQKMRDLSPI